MTATKPKTPAATKPNEPVVAVEDIDIVLPPKPARANNGKGKYPFADLAVNKFFSVKGKTRRSMASAIANANKRYRSELKDEAGKVLNTVQDREFYAVDVDTVTAAALVGSTHEGATVLVIRSK